MCKRTPNTRLGLLGCLGEPLQRLTILPQVDALVLLEVVGKVVDDALVKVVAAQVRIAARAQHLENAIAHLAQRLHDVRGEQAG